jgi:isopentenyl diphosphate isomerase/L-lactate dehydrogenase-like FMN-dependent dehydrogenase
VEGAAEGPEAVVEWLEVFFAELSVALFLSGASSVREMKGKRIIILGRMGEWLQQLGYDLKNGW